MNTDALVFVAVGFVAQLIDGALGMAYGVTSNSLLLTFGFTPAMASASIHAAEIVTSGISGAVHHTFGNVDRKLVVQLAVPGAIGAAIGAYLLVQFPSDSIRVLVAAYLLVIGLRLLLRAVRRPSIARPVTTKLKRLGLIGGFLDAVGGGGWGPVVVSTLVARGAYPRTAIGSANLAEFFVTVAASVVFFLTIGLQVWLPILGLIVGGSLAAPLAAFVTRMLPSRVLMGLVGGLIAILSIRTLIVSLP